MPGLHGRRVCCHVPLCFIRGAALSGSPDPLPVLVDQPTHFIERYEFYYTTMYTACLGHRRAL